MSGLVVMVEPMMIVTAMDMPLPCGRFQSIPQSMMVEQLFMMNHVHQHLLQHSVMVEVVIHKQVNFANNNISFSIPGFLKYFFSKTIMVYYSNTFL